MNEMNEKSDQARERGERRFYYWPLLRSSVFVAIVVLLAEFIGVMLFALARGAGVSLSWLWILPLFVVETSSRSEFAEIVLRAVCVAALVGAVASSHRLIWAPGRLQTQAGRCFGWLDIAGLGVADLTRPWTVDDRPLLPWMVSAAAVIFGVVMFGASAMMVWGQYQDRQEVTQDEGVSDA